MAPFDLAFADPPYAKGLGAEALGALRDGGWLREGGIAVVEEETGTLKAPLEGFDLLDQRAYGDTGLWIMRVTSLDNE